MFELAEAPADAARAVPAFECILSWLATEQRWHWIDVGGWAQAGEWWRNAVQRFPETMNVVAEHVMPNPIVDLPSSWDLLLRGVGRQFRQNIRTEYNGLARNGLNLEYREHREVEALDSLLDSLVRFHRERSQRTDREVHYNVFSDPQVESFIRRVSRRMMDGCTLTVASLSLNGEPAALRLQMEINGALYFYHSGFDQRFWKYGISTLVQVESMKTAIARGLSSVNLSLGAGAHTERWHPRTTQYERLQVVRNTRGSHAARAVYDRLRLWRRRVRTAAALGAGSRIGYIRARRDRNAALGDRTGLAPIIKPIAVSPTITGTLLASGAMFRVVVPRPLRS